MTKYEMVMSLVSKEELELMYEETPNLRLLSEKFSVSQQTMSRVMKHYGIEIKKPIGNKKHHFDETFFSVIDTEEKAYWLGFIMADGCVYRGSGETDRLQINLKYEDLPHLNKFQKSLGSDYKIQIKKVKTYQVAQLKINSTNLCKDLIRLGVIPKKSLVCEMPLIDEKLVRHFIRGYFDGDGCVRLSVGEKICRSFSIAGGEPMLKSINDRLRINIRNLNRGNELFSVDTSGKEDLLRIYDYLYQDATVYLQRKKHIYDVIKYLLESPLMV